MCNYILDLNKLFISLSKDVVVNENYLLKYRKILLYLLMWSANKITL